MITSCAPVRALSRPTTPPQSAPPMIPAMTATIRWMHDRQVPVEADEAGEGRAQDDLALGADVEQAGPEGQADREPGQDQRSRVGERLRERVEDAGDRARRR